VILHLDRQRDVHAADAVHAVGQLCRRRGGRRGRATRSARAAAASGLTAPTTLRTAFESPDGFASATLEATAELEAIQRYDAAAKARPDGSDPLVQLGLWGTTPEPELASSRTLFATGDLNGSATTAGSALSTWTGAAETGRGRAISLGVLVLAIVAALVVGAIWLRGRRRRGRVTMTAGDAGI